MLDREHSAVCSAPCRGLPERFVRRGLWELRTLTVPYLGFAALACSLAVAWLDPSVSLRVAPVGSVAAVDAGGNAGGAAGDFWDDLSFSYYVCDPLPSGWSASGGLIYRSLVSGGILEKHVQLEA